LLNDILSAVSVVKKDSTANKKSGFFGLSGTFSHILLYETNSRSYKDGYPGSGFYRDTLISNTRTNDSIYSRTIKKYAEI